MGALIPDLVSWLTVKLWHLEPGNVLPDEADSHSGSHGRVSLVVTLRLVGCLSVLVFFINYTFEVLHFSGLYESRRFLLAWLQLAFSLWALVEVLLVNPGKTDIPLGSLKIALLAQGLIGASRYSLAYFLDRHAEMGAIVINRLEFGLATLYVPLYLILFLAISWLLIDAFTCAERQKTELLKQEISIRERAEEALRNSERRYRLIADRASDVVWTLDSSGAFTYVSPSVERLRGYTPAEVMRQSIKEALTPASLSTFLVVFNNARSSLGSGLPLDSYRGELEQPCKNGSTVWTEVTTNGVYLEDGSFAGLVGISRDISERRRLETELRQARRDAEAASQAKSRFLAHMSHEIRTPMNAILGLGQILGREPLTLDQHDLLGKIGEAGRGLLDIINDILDFSKIEAGQMHIESCPFNLDDVLNQIEVLVADSARAKSLEFHIQPPETLPGGWRGDAVRLRQVLLNLASNAIKFTERGKVELRVRPVIVTPVSARLRFEVTDTGIGIAPEALARLFQPFTQADPGTTRRFGGTGLGLSISKRLVELMRGTIGATSTPGRGSTFWFELPLDRDARSGPAPARPAASGAPASRAPRLTGLRVLAVDDNRTNLLVLERALQLEDVKVILASNGRQALDILRADPGGVDAVLMDVQMPVLDGLAATRAIRADPGLARLPVIALTAGVLAEEREAARDAGVDGFLAKPLDLETMVGLLLTHVLRHREDSPADVRPG